MYAPTLICSTGLATMARREVGDVKITIYYQNVQTKLPKMCEPHRKLY